MIKVKNITFSYNGFMPIFRNLNLDIQEGGIYGLLGQNGAGKSTLLHLMCGMLTPDDGEIIFNDKDVRLRLPSTLCDTFIVPEEFDLPAITMAEYCKINAPFYPKFSVDDLKANLAMFDLDYEGNLAALSMGQKKKAFMCFALACNTKLLIMDEPTNGLDIPSKVQFRRFIASHMTDDRIIIISTHQVHDIELLLDHIIVINGNDVVINSTINSICSKLNFYTSLEPIDETKVVFSSKTLGGIAYISLRNDSDEESELNLESLFQFCLTQPEMVKAILSDNKPHNEQ